MLFWILGILLLIVTYALSDVNIAVKFKLFEDVLLSSQMLLFHLAALFYAFELLSKDRHQGLFVLPLSTGMGHGSYLFSLWGGISIMVTILWGLFALVDVGILFLIEGEVHLLIIWQLFLYLLSALLVTALVVAGSRYVPSLNALIYAITFWMVGGGLDELLLFAEKGDSAALYFLASGLFYIFPNFSFFDFQSMVVNRAPLDAYAFYLFPIIYFLTATFLILMLGWLQYRKQALHVGD